MKKRTKMSKKASRKSFTKNAMKVHPKNRKSYVMRGGTRL